MKIKSSFFLLSILSTVALTSATKASSSNSIEDKNVKSCPHKKKIVDIAEHSLPKGNPSRDWLNKSGVFPILPLFPKTTSPTHLRRETADVARDSESSRSITLANSMEKKTESLTASSHASSQSRSRADLDASVANGASYTGPLTPQQRQIQFVLKSTKDLVEGNLSAVFAVLDRSDIESHPVYSNDACHDFYKVALPVAVNEIRRNAHPDKYAHKLLNSRLWKKLSSQHVPLIPSDDQTSDDFSKSSSHVFGSLELQESGTSLASQIEPEPGFVVRKAKRVFNKLKAILCRGLS